MATGRDDFIIAIRSAFLKKKDKQKFSLLTLIFLSIFVIVLSNFNFKAIQLTKLAINEVIYRSSYIASIPENKISNLISEIETHIDLHKKHQKDLIKIENTQQIKLLNNFLITENKKLRKLIDESISSKEIYARVLIDKDSPYKTLAYVSFELMLSSINFLSFLFSVIKKSLSNLICCVFSILIKSF